MATKLFGDINVELIEGVLTLGDLSNQKITIKKEHLADFIEYLTATIEQDYDDKRIGFRIPINQLNANTRKEIRVTIEKDNQKASITLIDFSICGMQVKGEIDFPVDTKSEIISTIEYKYHTVSIRTKFVRKTHNQQYAFHFPDSVNDGELDPPDELIVVFRALEFEWLRQRIL